MRNAGLVWLWCILLFSSGLVAAREVTINTVGGPVTIDIGHIGPSGDIVVPRSPRAPGFGPPSIFSAPLPSGSGARALGVAGAFTAEADDATAASWNPAGLVQLERPEASVVIRAGREKNRHHSNNDDFQVGVNEYGTVAVNYLSAVWPFRMGDRNWVFSINYQEAYDFSQEFSADLTSQTAQRTRSSSSGVYTETRVDHFTDGTLELDVESHLQTRTVSVLDQALRSQMVSDLDFKQEGVVDALSPALAVEVTPRLSVGVAVNLYQNDLVGGDPIRTETTAAYSGDSSSDARIFTTRTTSGTYEYSGVLHVPAGGGLPPIDIPIAKTTGSYDPFTTTDSSREQTRVMFDGLYEEVSTYYDLGGENLTLGLLYSVNRFVGIGATVDTGWRADARQSRTVRNTIRTYSANGGDLLSESVSVEQESRRVEFNFPLYWAFGLVGRWTHLFHTTLDVSQTLWSDFWYRSGG